MSPPTILEANGRPAFVVLPYKEYRQLVAAAKPASHPRRIPAGDSVPHEVMSLKVANDWSLIRAWREYLGLTQAEVARRLEVRQPTYARMEAPDARPRLATRQRIAAALGVSAGQLED